MDGHRLIHTNGTLLLRAVKAEDSGYYTCTATNTGGFDTIIVNLLVQGEAPQGRQAGVGMGTEPGGKLHCARERGLLRGRKRLAGRRRPPRTRGAKGRGGRRAGEGTAGVGDAPAEGQSWSLPRLPRWGPPPRGKSAPRGEAWRLAHSSPGPAAPHRL